MNEALYTELWNACAGPLVTLPRKGERAYYFPECHIEQLEALMNQSLEQPMPSFNFPSKILCNVINVARKVEAGNGEVFAQIDLLPLPDQTGPVVLDKYLPPLDMSNESESPSQDLVASDFHKNERRFKHIYRVLGLFHGIMHIGVLGTAARSIMAVSMFTVFLKPRTSRSEFVVGVNRYLDSKNQKSSVGMRFKMRFEGEDAHEKIGTIVSVEEITFQDWGDSEWRALKIQWDEPSSIVRPERVSHWELEVLDGNNSISSSLSQPPQKNKRSRPPSLPSSTANPLASGVWKPLARAPTSVSWFPPFAQTTTFGDAGKKQAHENGCKLFRIELVETSDTPKSFSHVTVAGAAGVGQLVNEIDSKHQTEPTINQSEIPLGIVVPEKSASKIPQDSKSRQIRSYTKVCFIDDEGDKMMVGDHQWHELCGMVRKIFINKT
ncbi:hypothetical protein AALP_AA1G109700 [Arabis alpina]|uniref:Auxin response factor domain-containing protein n=1 Tax=Arabis alpina TaxID=50452 RepID=A0A087HMH0_ARAAL|nr:hypothetical protein AALP_AA1G109700 [Arabis alpina]